MSVQDNNRITGSSYLQGLGRHPRKRTGLAHYIQHLLAQPFNSILSLHFFLRPVYQFESFLWVAREFFKRRKPFIVGFGQNTASAGAARVVNRAAAGDNGGANGGVFDPLQVALNLLNCKSASGQIPISHCGLANSFIKVS